MILSIISNEFATHAPEYLRLKNNNKKRTTLFKYGLFDTERTKRDFKLIVTFENISGWRKNLKNFNGSSQANNANVQ